MAQYTVVGIYTETPGWDRAAFWVEADSPRHAEEIANDEDHGDDQLTVAGVFEGHLTAVDEQ